jgi:ATP-dependent protease HslVU (ClpYQ) peptidase subunit
VTCIAGVADNGHVYLAGDSAGSSGWELTVRADPKVFVNGPYVLGFTTSFRFGQLLRYAFSPPAPETGDLHGFMCTAFVDALRTCLKEAGWAIKENEQESGGASFLAGVSGQMFIVHADYQVGTPADPYAAVGCGAQVALGALHATADTGLLPVQRLGKALAAAERFSNGVRGPATVVCTP